MEMAEPGAAAVPIKELPPEIWKKILSNVDEPELMNCRLVNKCLRDLSNEVLRESAPFWEVTFGMEPGAVLYLISGRHANFFSRPEQITRFMEEMKGTSNPFPNGTVIFMGNWTLTVDEHVAFQDNFCKLLDVFNDAILNLGYSENGTELNNNQLCSILGLKNLKSLAIDSGGSWRFNSSLKSICGHKLFQEMLQSKQVTVPEKLTELHIYGKDSFIPLFYMFGGTESILKSVSSLEISGFSKFRPTSPPNPSPDERLAFPLCQFPNLKRLKLRYPDAKLLQQFQQFQPNSMASLKEVSFYFSEFHGPIEQSLKEAFAMLDFHAQTLELLHLDLENNTYCCFHDDNDYVYGYDDEDFENDANQIFTSVAYTKLRTLALRHADIINWPAVIRELMAKFVNLQELELILPRAPEASERYLKYQYKEIVALWDLLPATHTVSPYMARIKIFKFF